MYISLDLSRQACIVLQQLQCLYSLANDNTDTQRQFNVAGAFGMIGIDQMRSLCFKWCISKGEHASEKQYGKGKEISWLFLVFCEAFLSGGGPESDSVYSSHQGRDCSRIETGPTHIIGSCGLHTRTQRPFEVTCNTNRINMENH